MTAVFTQITSINCEAETIFRQEIKVIAQYPMFKR